MFRAISGVALSLIFTVALHAAEEPKPNTLTSKEIEEGWILLFDGETTFGWTGKDSDLPTAKKGFLASPDKGERPVMTTTAWRLYDLRFEYFVPKDGMGLLVLGCDRTAQNSDDALPLTLNHEEAEWYNARVTVEAGKVSFEYGPSDTEATTVGLRRAAVQMGSIGFQGVGAHFRNVKLKPLDTKPLFTGKDLSGWKKFEADLKRAKSEFSVTKEGWLHLKDGPGDLQTEKEWSDFVLQIECFCNGDKLNSGVFFRCRPGEYQNGYEAQIHNGFTDKPEKEYAIEEYDPEWHKLTATKKVKYQAMDYGTGGIYRRMSARRAVAKDKEWFTMTVVAQGRHIATWVNGIQVVDWTDNRPEDDNARNGCKLGKGPISLQGHDATTDLSFRNIRIAELSK